MVAAKYCPANAVADAMLAKRAAEECFATIWGASGLRRAAHRRRAWQRRCTDGASGIAALPPTTAFAVVAAAVAATAVGWSSQRGACGAAGALAQALNVCGHSMIRRQ
jgi:hypothetical protein